MAVNIESLTQAHGSGPTVGVKLTDGKLRVRQEIDDFIRDPELANLYILALLQLQKHDSWKDRFLYFQIAG